MGFKMIRFGSEGKDILLTITTTEDDINNNTVRGTVIVQIARAAEDFNIDFIVTNRYNYFKEWYYVCKSNN